MTHIALPSAAPKRSPGLAARLWRALLRMERRRADRMRLDQLDDHLLRDIGIHRGDIAAVVRRGRSAL